METTELKQNLKVYWRGEEAQIYEINTSKIRIITHYFPWAKNVAPEELIPITKHSTDCCNVLREIDDSIRAEAGCICLHPDIDMLLLSYWLMMCNNPSKYPFIKEELCSLKNLLIQEIDNLKDILAPWQYVKIGEDRETCIDNNLNKQNRAWIESQIFTWGYNEKTGIKNVYRILQYD
ncbi:hypothetical protein AGMMS50249_4740 [candidate division SR1 bacterium]|nr:hypothetical protein AGMMS50249_4740 [candidate division SR1 bacterium]